ncbi:hypothetical protein PENTCL1PPCAC_9106, partial [Pristionchus entomophagus]
SSSETIDASSPPSFFSLHSHRLVICVLLLAANYFSLANSLGLSTAVVCMVNSSSSRPLEMRQHQQCVVQHDESSKHTDFAIPGTMDWSASQRSLLLSARVYGGCLTVAFLGMKTDRLGSDVVMSGFLLLSSAITLATPLLAYTSYYVLLASRFFLGSIDSLQTPAVNCIATRWFPTGEKTTAASIYTTGLQFAGGFSSLFAASLCRSSFFGGWPSIFYVFGGASLIFAIFWIAFGTGGPSKNRWLDNNERAFLEDRIKVKAKGKRTTPLSIILSSKLVHAIMVCNFGSAFTTTIMQAFLPLFLRELGLPINMIGWYTLTPFLTEIAGKALSGPLIDYCVRRKITTLTRATKIAQFIGSFGSSIALMLLSLIPSCDNPTIALYILITFGVVRCGYVSGVYTSSLSISPANVGTISSLTAIAKMAASLASTTLVNGFTSSEVPYKWTLIFAVASIIQSIGGLHFLIFGTSE